MLALAPYNRGNKSQDVTERGVLIIMSAEGLDSKVIYAPMSSRKERTRSRT